MLNIEKLMNILLSLLGVLYLVSFGLYIMDYFQPSEISIACNMLIIGLFCLTMRWSVCEKKG